ncbi:MAG TPA: PilZ domain-containing protein [Bryobacteraceae bacterium]|nr:PilZ domain-containing protein [Bryobacteraceae bacterium]
MPSRRGIPSDPTQSEPDQQTAPAPDPARKLEQQSPFVERRREPRYAANEIVEVQVIGAPGGRFRGVILDVSRSGLRIEVGKPLAKGAHVEIVLSSRAILFGEARYCISRNKLYQVGVEIESLYFAKDGA